MSKMFRKLLKSSLISSRNHSFFSSQQYRQLHSISNNQNSINFVYSKYNNYGFNFRFKRYSSSSTTNASNKKFSTVFSASTEMTMEDVKNTMAKRLGIDISYNPVPASREYLLQHEPKPECLPPRTMKDSLTSAIIPFKTDLKLRDAYVTFLGSIRHGRLMEDLDYFAIWVCHQHLFIPNRNENVPIPYTFVTVLVDKVDFTDFIARNNENIRLTGHVSWVGRSSMEVIIWLEQMCNDEWQKLTKAIFLIAARNATNTKALAVNPLKITNPEEERIFNEALCRKERRKKLQTESLLKTEPNDIEQRMMHDLFLQTIDQDKFALNHEILPANSKWMSDTELTNIIISQPEHRNTHNTVFGGFLMRNALEVSWACAFMHSKFRPKLEHICDITFRIPIDVSSFIKMTAHVIYTERNYMQIIVVADVLHPSKQKSSTYIVFHYTYSIPEQVKKVFPRTYQEAIWYVEGKRKFCYAMNVE